MARKARKSPNIDRRKGKMHTKIFFLNNYHFDQFISRRSNSIPNTEWYQKKDENKSEPANKKVNNINVAIAKRKEFKSGQNKGKEKVFENMFFRPNIICWDSFDI